jgi:hypothetical protein
MTMPNERTRALIWAGEFLREVRRCDSVPENLKAKAYQILRHYPATFEIQQAATMSEHGLFSAWLATVENIGSDVA